MKGLGWRGAVLCAGCEAPWECDLDYGLYETVDVIRLLIFNIDPAVLSQFLFLEEHYSILSLHYLPLTWLWLIILNVLWNLYFGEIIMQFLNLLYKWKEIRIQLFAMEGNGNNSFPKNNPNTDQWCMRSRVYYPRPPSVFKRSFLILCVLCSQSPRFWRNVQSLLSIMEWWTGSTGCPGSPPTSSVSGR